MVWLSFVVGIVIAIVFIFVGGLKTLDMVM